MKKISWILILGILSVGVLSPLAQAKHHESEDKKDDVSDVTDMTTVTCRDLLRTDNEDRRDTIVFMHGYINGKKGDMTINGTVLAESSDKIIDACIDQPNNKLLDVFETHR